jgi:methylated-DNA-protein-cysteine methyltransferase related protein
MSGSPFFARIKRDVLMIMDAVPQGRLVTFQDVGRHLDVMPRHVAYILSQLGGAEQAATPWFRAVADNGTVANHKINDFGISQRDLLIAEGHLIPPDGRILDFGQKIAAVSDLNSGVPAQKRPEDAPVAKARKPRQRSRT